MKKFFGLLITLCLLIWPLLSQAVTLKSTYPRLANYFLKWDISDAEARELAKWDLVVIDMEAQENTPKQLRKIRELHPDIIMIAYVTSQEIFNNANNINNAPLRRKLSQKIIDGWWLRDTAGNKISNWPGTSLLNLSDGAQVDMSGDRFNDYLPEFVMENIKASGFWDGVFYDNTWGDIFWMNNGDLDLNNNGLADSQSNADSLWSEGFKKMLSKTRELAGNDFIIIGNGKVYSGYHSIDY